MDYQDALRIAAQKVLALQGHTIDVVSIKKPKEIQGAVELAKIISKLSPIIGNLLEYAMVEYLNTAYEWPSNCKWVRQDPGFPDTVLQGMNDPQPGIEIKTWFPLATEITARFRDTQMAFKSNQTKLALLCWLPEFVIAGQPKLIDIWIGDALEIAQTRDEHYHNPPHYVVLEPEDTRRRTKNLQQTNCNGLKFQGTPAQLVRAERFVATWGKAGKAYRTDRAYQSRLRELTGKFPYRLDTNFAKLDRIVLPSLESFKSRILATMYAGRAISQWIRDIESVDRQVLQTLVDRQS
ncbi:MAG: hypothetical protein HZC40_09265 [Chloroflexi bacterium]|nr:hypothetical protein [Chloroflexota bacterium]